MVTEALTLVRALKQYVFDGDSAALMVEWKALTDKDKNDLCDYFEAEGIAVSRP